MLIDYAMFKAKNNGLKDEFYDGAMYCMKNRTVQEFEIDENFEKKYSELKEKYLYRNLDYIALQ